MFTWLKRLFSKKGRSNVIMKTALTWEQAKAWMFLGEKIKHKDWPESTYFYIENGILHCNPDGYISAPNEKELLKGFIGNPWQVV